MYQMKGLSERKVKMHEATNYLLRVFPEDKKAASTNVRYGEGHGAVRWPR